MRSIGFVGFSIVSAIAFGCGGDEGGAGSAAGAGSGGAAAGQGGQGLQAGASGGGSAFDAGTDPARNQVQPGGICARLAAIQCAGEQACCEQPGRDFDACVDAIEGACSATVLLDDIAAAPEVAFDAQAASTGFAELESRAAVCDPSVASWAVSRDGFTASFAGTLGEGDDCEPEGGLQAAIPSLLAALAACRVGSDLACLPGADAWVCAPRASPGSRCFTDFNCADGLYCENPDSGFDGACAARKAAGSECESATECTSFVCESGMCAAEDDVQAAYCLN